MDEETNIDIKVEEKTTEKQLPQIIDEIKAQYDQQIEDLKEDFKNQIAERDSVIKQLLSGKKLAPTETIVDKINKNRNYKKW